METPRLAGLILAAGFGTRMKSQLPKVLHQAAGLPLAEWVARAMLGVGIVRPTLVIGYEGERVRDTLGNAYEYVWQREPQGTGHAVLQAAEWYADWDGVLIVAAGDTPLLDSAALASLIEHHRATGAQATVGVFRADDPAGYGRIIRREGRVVGNVEKNDADDEVLAQKHDLNAGLYAFHAPTLFRHLRVLQPNPKKGEYYLTDVLGMIHAEGGLLEAKELDADVALGVNDPWELAEAASKLRMRILRRHAVDGVAIRDPHNCYVDADVEIGPGTILEPGVVLAGHTHVGAGCHIGPWSRIKDSRIGDGTTFLMSHADRAEVGSGAWVGPFANLRPRARLGDGVKVGNFVEIKNAELADEAKVSHLSYIGDATVGRDANIGAGTITCNYDGLSKHQTVIGAEAFVGSNSTLVAPLEIGEGAVIAAGSTITKDVPADALGIGRSRQENKEDWARKWRKRKQL